MAELIPCKFFVRGCCQFGDACRYYHGSGGGGSAQIRPNPNVFSPQPQYQTQPFPTAQPAQNRWNPATTTTISARDEEIATLMKSIRDDMREWQESKIWPLSAYGPLALRPTLPGSDDLSVEEIRYACLMSGNTIPSELNLELRYKQVNDFWTRYSQVSADSLHSIKTLLETPYETLNSTLPRFLATYQPPPPQNSLPTSTISLFGNNQSSIKMLQTNPSFGTTQNHNQTSSLSSFNFTTQTPSSTTPTMEVLEGGNTPDTFSFSLPSTSLAQGIQQPGSAFSRFNFSQPLSQPSAFGNSRPPQQNSTSTSWATFGSNLQVRGSPLNGVTHSGSKQIQEELVYSREEDMSAQDIASFEASTFDKVPLLAPASRFC